VNKRAISSVVVVLVLVVIVGLVMITIWSGIAGGSVGPTADSFCRWNVRFALFAGWDFKTWQTKMSETRFCHQYEDLIEISTDDIDCSSFINFGKDTVFGLSECPYTLEQYELSSDGLSLPLFVQQYEDQLEEQCQYRTACENTQGVDKTLCRHLGIDCKAEEVAWSNKYAPQQVALLVERCLYMSMTRGEFDVDCFTAIITGDDAETFKKDVVTEVAEYSKSAYNPQETIDIEHFNDKMVFRQAKAKVVSTLRGDDKKFRTNDKFMIHWAEKKAGKDWQDKINICYPQCEQLS